MKLCIYLFGKPRLLVDEQPFRFSAPPRTFPLLAYLLLQRERPSSRQQLAFTFWPDETEAEARANLRRHLHHLRHGLPPETDGCPWLLLEDAAVQWNPLAPLWLDVEQMERLARCPGSLEEAVQLYSGDLLETVYDDWVFPRREELRELYHGCLNQLVGQRRSSRDTQGAVRYARQLLASDPFREDTQRQLMAALYEGGNRAGALQEYEAFERRLRREMEVEPMPETRALFELILRNARLPGEEAAQASPASVPCAAELLPFAGREAELGAVLTRWGSAARGRGGLLLVGGEAGVGKSRLAREFSLLAEAQGGRVISGAASPEETRPYQALAEALRSALPLLAAIQQDPARQALLAELLPELRQGRRLPSMQPLDPAQARLRLFDAVASLLVQLAEPRPLLLILEDLHWAGESTLELLEFITRRAAGAALLILGTYRDEEVRRRHPLSMLRRSLKASGLVEHLPLGRLSRASVETMLGGVSSGAGAPGPGLADWLFHESEGHPLFIQVLWQQFQAEGLAEISGSNRAPFAAGIRAAIARRLERLSPETRAYAEAASVLGPAFEAETARELGGWSEFQAYEALRDLLDCRLLYDGGGRPRGDYVFSHHLIQAALYEEMPPASRQRRHRRAAEVTEELYPEARQQFAGELALHYDRGGVPGQAVLCYQAAARRFLESYDDSQAIRCLERAIQLQDRVSGGAPSRLLADLLLQREEICSRGGKRSAQSSDLQRLVSLAASLDDPALACEVEKRQILYYRALDDRPAQEAHLGRLHRLVEATGDPRWQAEAVYIEGNLLKLLADFPRAVPRLQQALELYRQLQDPQGQVSCCCELAEIAIMKRESAEAEHWAQQALALGRGEAPGSVLLALLWNVAAQRLMVKDLQGCLEAGRKLLEASGQAGDRVWQAHAHRLMGIAFQRQFRIAEARAALAQAYEAYQLVQKPKGCALTLQAMGHVEVSLGCFEAAVRNYRQALDIRRRLDDHQGSAEEHINLAFTASLMGDFESVKQQAGKALELARSLERRHLVAHALQNLGDAERGLGNLEQALRHLLEAGALFTDPGEAVERVSVEAELALTYMELGDLPQALRAAEEILKSYPSIAGEDDNTHRLLWIAARTLQAAGQSERAARALQQAYQAFQSSLSLIPEPESRRAYAGMRHNREIAAAYERGEWP